MAFTYQDQFTDYGSASSAGGTHGMTISDGDLLVAYLNVNDNTPTPSMDTGGATWTEAYNNTVVGESCRQAMWWKVANGSEPSSYTVSLGATRLYGFIVLLFSSSTDAEVDQTILSDDGGTNVTYIAIDAANGATVATDCVAVGFGAKDSGGDGTDYTTATTNWTAFGNADGGSGYIAGGAYRIYGTGETISGAIDVKTADENDGRSEGAYSVFMSFLESAAAGGAYPYPGRLNSIQYKHILSR